MDKIIFKNKTKERIDKFLSREFFSTGQLTRGEIIRQIKTGTVLVNNKKIKPSYILKEGDIITQHVTRNTQQNKITPNDKIELDIIYQDENIVVINKPAGIQIHPDHNEKENTIVNALLAKFPEISAVGDNPKLRPGIVHRLDKDTSGILIIAKNQKTFLELKKKFKNREITKKYWAIVFGRLGDLGIIDKPLARAASYKKQVVAGRKTKTKIREAITEYKVLKEVADYSLVEVTPKTGRTHQIRVHMTSIGHPIVGDKTYKLKKYFTSYNIKRHLLHALSLEFSLRDKTYKFEAPLPPDFQKFLAKIENLDSLDSKAKKG